MVNFPFICSNIPTAPTYGIYISHPTAPTYGIYISQLIRYSRACGSLKFYGRRHDLVNSQEMFMSQMTTGMLRLS